MSCEDGIEDIVELSSDLYINDYRKTSDLFHLSGAFYDACSIKIAFVIFITYILMNTDIFAESVLSKISKKNYDMSSDKITGRGIVTSAMLFSLFYIIIDILYKCKVI
jgi:hypothetical protein